MKQKNQYRSGLKTQNIGEEIMNLRHSFLLTLLWLMSFTAISANAAPSYRSFIEWNGPYYHIRHGLNADSSAYLDYLVNTPLPLYGSPFSSPVAIETYNSVATPQVFVVDHDQRRVQVFGVNASWNVEALLYSATPVQGNYGANSIKFSLGGILPGSEKISINGNFFTRVNSLTGYTSADSVYTIVYDGVPNTGGVATLPIGWVLSASDSVRAEYGYASPSGTAGVNDIDYILYQTTPTDIPLQLNETSSASDPAMTDLTAIAVNASVRAGKVVDIYLVNALTSGAGTLASYDLTSVGPTGAYSHVDTYPGTLGRPYDVEVIDRGLNTAASIAEGTPSGTSNAILSESIVNQNTFLSHNYRIAFSFDTATTMNQSSTPANQESDLYFDQITGRLHMVFCRDNAAQGTAYSYSDDYGQTWSTAVTVSSSSLTGAHDCPRIAVLHSGEIHVVFEAINASAERHLYHTFSGDGVNWSTNVELTSAITPSVVTENRYATLMVNPLDVMHLIWSGDDDVYHRVYSGGAWGATTLFANGAGTGFSAPSAVMDNVGRIYCAYVSDAGTPSAINYMLFNGAVWGSYELGGFTSSTPDPVTAASGVLAAGGGRGEVYPFPQITLAGDSVWIFWAGTGTETYPTDPINLRYNLITSQDGNFTLGAGTAFTTADAAAPMRFTVSTDALHNIHIVYPFGNGANVDREGLRYTLFTASAGTWSSAGTTGRNIFNTGAAATTYAYEPRLVTPTINERVAPFLSTTKAYTSLGAGSPRALFKVIDGVLTVTDQTTLSEINQWAVWNTGVADARTIPGLSFTITNTAITISNTDNVDATEFNVGDYFDLTSTAGSKNDLLFFTDSDNHRFKVIRGYDNIDNCFGGDVRWDVPGKSDGTPSQTYKLGTVGGEESFRVWASPDSTAWTIVDNLLIAGPTDRVCEVDRYTKEVRFGDGSHGLIPPSGTFVRVRYDESVDEADFGSVGSGSSQMNYPRGIAVNYNSSHGQYDVYVCDTGNNRIKKFAYNPDTDVSPHNWTSAIVSWGTASSATDNLSSPEDVEVVTQGSDVFLVVSDRGNSRLVIYRDDEASGSGGNTAPSYVSTVGGTGNLLNQFMDPRGMGIMAEDSGLVIFAADADRDVVTKIISRDWLTSLADDTTGGGGTQDNTLRLSLQDALDEDAYLLMQPGATRVVQLMVTRTDSVTAVKAQCSFTSAQMEVVSISEGNLWSGERYTNKVFLYDIDNTAGSFEINTSMVGDNDGLSTTGEKVMATIVVRARATAQVPSSGPVSFTDSTEIRQVGNLRLSSYTRTALNIRIGNLADLATTGGDPGTPPNMVPAPDGRIDFADVNVFTQGWNGDGVNFDPISDIGPYLGTTVPNLISDPDGLLDAYDLLALNTMYNWSHGSGTLIAPDVPRGSDGNLDGTRPITLVQRLTESGWVLEIQARNISDLTSAHLFMELNNLDGSIQTVNAGEFLGESPLFLHTVQSSAADICLGRLNREAPSVSGSGVLARVNLILPAGQEPNVTLSYELRNSQNQLLGFSQISSIEPEAVPTEFSLGTPYPNPFNATTTFTINLTDAASVKLRIYNMLGQEVATVTNRELPAGTHRLNWEAKDNGGKSLTTGLYFARLESGGRESIRKLVLMR